MHPPGDAEERTADGRSGGERPSAPHAATVEEVLDALETDASGLSTDQAAARLEAHGPNEIRGDRGVSPVAIFVSQFRDVLVYLLVVAAALSLLAGTLPGSEPNYTDAALILLILLANGVFGFVQDYRAERSIEALRDLSSPDATVIRDGGERRIDVTEVVPGDVLVVEGGDAIPADARIVESHGLEVDESALTGESASVEKVPDATDAGAPLAERSSMVYMNTAAVSGRATAVVVATGMATEVGDIATRIAGVEEEPTPFQDEIDRLGRQIGAGVVGLIVLVAATQLLFTATGPVSVLLVGVTLAVAAVPEGLPAVVTLTLAMGSRRMLARNALVRRLPVVESLGSVDTIVTDKTGTLTESRMTVSRIYADGRIYGVTGTGTGTGIEGGFRLDGEPVDPAPLEPLLRCGAVCNDAELARPSAEEGYSGDPTEVALLVSAAKAGIEPDRDRVREIPFSSERKRMTVLAEEDGGTTAYTKGAPAVVLERCDRVLDGGEVRPLSADDREAILGAVESFAGDALRVLGFARRTVENPAADAGEIERGMVFLGLQGMIDPPREEVPGAMADCRRAGVRVVMTTGDGLVTAIAIGEQIGFEAEGALTGREVEDLSDGELRRAVEEVEVFARVSPGDKVRILESLQANGHRVAMTGDGVNDAPALRGADVGISMGRRGTDVAKQASDMVLLDDDFATIRDAIAEGRGIFDNVRKFVGYLLSANVGEVLVVFVGTLVGTFLLPERFAADSEALILTPAMLLWINLVTDGLPALALGADPAAADVMERPPRGSDDGVIDAYTAGSVAAIGAAMTLTGLALFFFTLARTGGLARAQTLLFTFLVTVEIVRVQLVRSRYDLSPGSNPWLLAAIAATLVLQLAVLYTPLAGPFGVLPVAPRGWAWIAVAFAGFLALNLAATRLLGRAFPVERRG